MTARKTHLQSTTHSGFDIAFKFAVGATGAVGAISGKGVESVVRDSAGQYTITLKGPIGQIINVAAMLEEAALTDLVPQVLSTDASANQVVIGHHITGATPTATDPPDGSFVHVRVHCAHYSSV